jgi:hypothetical protein
MNRGETAAITHTKICIFTKMLPEEPKKRGIHKKYKQYLIVDDLFAFLQYLLLNCKLKCPSHSIHSFSFIYFLNSLYFVQFFSFENKKKWVWWSLKSLCMWRILFLERINYDKNWWYTRIQINMNWAMWHYKQKFWNCLKFLRQRVPHIQRVGK